MPRPKKPVACPDCKSTDFQVCGYIAYAQPYNSETDDYGSSKMHWDEDYQQYVQCARCERDVTQLFKQRNILTEFFRTVSFEGGKLKYD